MLASELLNIKGEPTNFEPAAPVFGDHLLPSDDLVTKYDELFTKDENLEPAETFGFGYGLGGLGLGYSGWGGGYRGYGGRGYGGKFDIQ